MTSPDEDDGPCARAFEGCQLCGQRLTELHIEGVRLAVGHMEPGDLPLLDDVDHGACLLSSHVSHDAAPGSLHSPGYLVRLQSILCLPKQLQ